jgi:hypothetical protein
MAQLCNDPARCEVMNLGWATGGHGPYLVRQEGYEPGSSTFKPQRFILLKKGRWLLNLAFVLLPEAEQEAQLFHSMNEVVRFLDSLAAAPLQCDAALPVGVSEAEILQQFEKCTRRILRGMSRCAVEPISVLRP